MTGLGGVTGVTGSRVTGRGHGLTGSGVRGGGSRGSRASRRSRGGGHVQGGSRGVTGRVTRCTTELNDKVIQVVDKALSQLCLASQPANKLLPRSKKIRIDGRADL